LRLGPWSKIPICRRAPARPRRRPTAQLKHVLTDGELSGGEGLTDHDPRDLESGLGGSVLDGRRWNTAGDGEVRRPRGVTGVPGEGLVNTSKGGAHEHQ
jgi:hypothetical protein